MTLEEIKKALREKNVEAIKELYEFKKAQFKKADAHSGFVSTATNKIHTSNEGDTDTVIKRTIIGNTYNWLDSHGDVHLDGTFSKSINERQSKIWHLHDHEQKVTAKVGTPTKVYEQPVTWSDLGINKSGNTTSLMMDTDIKKAMNSQVFNEYKSDGIDQHSVGMYYVKLDLAVNDEEFEQEKKEWDNHIDKIGNKEKAISEGYFWAVKEAKLIEISAVLEGSNELTGTIPTKDVEPSKDTQDEPTKVTQTRNNDLLNFYKNLKQ